LHLTNTFTTVKSVDTPTYVLAERIKTI